MNYDNSITEARLQNNSLLAEIAYNALQQQLELSLQGFQYKNQLILDKTAKKLEVDQMYDNRYQNVLAQINHENAMAEQIRQYNESKELEREKLAEQIRQFNVSFAEDQRQFDETMAYNKTKSAGGSGGGDNDRRISGGDSKAEQKIVEGAMRTVNNIVEGKTGNKEATAEDYFNELYRAGASKSDVANAIAMAHQQGVIDTDEMVRLRKIFVTRGVEA